MTAKQEKMIEQLYLEMYALLLQYGRSSLGNESLAEEAIQETFQIACMKADELLSSHNPRGWLVNTLKNTIRNTKRVQENASRQLFAYIATHSNIVDFSEAKVSFEVMYEDLVQTEEFKLIKEMVIDKKSCLEMAQSRGISLNTCKKRIERAKKYLRRRI